VETNIVIVTVPDAMELAGRLWDAGVQVTPLASDRVRAVTHLDVDRQGIERALEAFGEALR
jgi:threonine aldolase